MIEVVVGIVAAAFVTDPTIAFGVNVGRLGMAWLIAKGWARASCSRFAGGAARTGARVGPWQECDHRDVCGACRGVGLAATARSGATSRVLLRESGQG